MKKILLSIAVMSISIVSMAQDVTVETILDNYFEAIGGRDAWNELEGHVMKASVDNQGMEIPLEIYAFSKDKIWVNYEHISSDIFDHLLAAIPYFNLECFELSPILPKI